MGDDEARRSFSPGDKPRAWVDIHDTRVIDAFSRVRREAFVPRHLQRWADRDAPLPIGYNQTISQPYVVAVMTQALGLRPGERVLEVGTGSGFQTAILCELVHETGTQKGATVYTIERFGSLAKKAQARLNALGYFPHIRSGDGALGWPEAESFDAILVTAAPVALPRPLWDQLHEAGRMVIPVGPQDGEQQLWRLRKEGARVLGTRLGAVRFVPLISPVLANPEQRIELG
jgi:protein-L-isoaspartate(D-aspartate) O-methyltransferase